MKRGIIFALLIILLIPLASASIFDWFNWFTGKVTGNETLSEQIKCVFVDSPETQKCYTDDGKFSCSGIGSCIVEISGASGTQFTWISSCSMKYPTTIDGTNKELKFSCPIPITSSTACGNGVCESGETCSSCPQDCGACATSEMSEQIKCMFYESNSYQKCYSDDGKFGCSGIGSCVADVSGEKGKQLIWKSSCGGEAYTSTDGINEYTNFKCVGQQTTSTTQPLSTLVVKEQVKCLFTNSDKPQECYSSEGFKCSGVGSCVVDIASDNLYGKQLMWKSTCGGYAYTIADGNNEYAEFKCGETIVQQPIAVTQMNIVKKATIYAFMQDKCSYCEKMKDFIAELKQKYTNVEANYVTVTPSSEQIYTIIVVAYLKKGVPATFLNDKVWNGFSDNIAKEIENEVKLCIEKGCPSNPNPPIPDEIKIYMTSTSTMAPRLASIGMPIPIHEGNVKEQIRCIFKNSDVLLNPHTARPEKCMTEDGQFGCIWDGNVEVSENGERKAYCVIMNVEAQKGTKLTWKSSCGGYSYSVMDGNNEDVEFSCIPATNVTSEQIGGKGFAFAYWQCYDGTEFKQDSESCKTSEVWREQAKTFCEGRCYSDKSKCGVNSFAISRDCYLESGSEGVVFIPVEKIGIEETKTEKIKEESLICKDSCPFDNKCYPFGYRKADRYCSDNNAFVQQLKAEEKCDNNFECESNMCLAGECISEGLIKKIINWFKKLFKASEETNAEVIDCGGNSACMEDAFKQCKLAKISQSDSTSEIIGLKGKNCVLKVTSNGKSMTCKIENYKNGTSSLGDMSRYCEGDLVKYLSEFTAKSMVQTPKTEKPTQVESLDSRSVCEKILNPSLKNKCMAIVTKDSSGCELVDETDRPYCYADVALVTRDSAICRNIKDSNHQKACEALVERARNKCSGWIYADYCYRDVAALTGNTAACDEIAYSGGKANCNAVVLRTVSFCQNADNEDCYQKLALLTGDETVCDKLSKIENTGERPMAIANLDIEVNKCVKMARKEINGCSPESGSGTDCDLIPAFAKNPSLCENLEVTYFSKDGCYFYAAMSLADLLPPQLIVLRN